MKDWQEEYQRKLIAAEEAAKFVKSGDLVVFTAGREALLLMETLLRGGSPWDEYGAGSNSLPAAGAHMCTKPDGVPSRGRAFLRVQFAW